MRLPAPARRLAGAVLRRTLKVVTSYRPVTGVRVLAYHSVDTTGSTLSVTPDELRGHLELLRRGGWRALSMAEYLRRLEDPETGEPGVLLTFDDAYENFYTAAAPILKSFGAAATVFVPADFIGEPPGWFERDCGRIEAFLNGFGFGTGELDAIRRMTQAESTRRLMTASQIRELLDAGFSFESHSAAHPFLPTLSDTELAADLSRSRDILESVTGVRPAALCYPYGVSDGRVHAAAARAGFAAGFNATYSSGAPQRFALPRVGVAGDTDLGFSLSAALDAYAALRRRAAASTA